MELSDEFNVKIEKMKKYLDNAGADGLALSRTDNFAWATCGGRNHVNVAQDAGVATFLLIDGKATVLSNNIEWARLNEEELNEIPVESATLPWLEDRIAYAMKEFIGDKKVLTDSPFGDLPALNEDFTELMYDLTPTELVRYRSLGARAGHAIQDTCKALKAGMTETAIAGMLAENCYSKGVEPIVILVATDERTKKYRHPLPNENKKLEKTAMVVLCGRRKGLIASCTRMVSIGEPGKEIQEKHGACVFVDVVMNMQTLPGQPIKEIFRLAKEGYWEAGFSREHENHHQGGPTGYRTRYYLATEESEGIVKPNTAYAWNPSISGTKSEDTIIVLDDHNEFITQVPEWPTIEIEGDEFSVKRPDILVL